jgi:NAD(P)-dependent dehydrogenase (short-subunit alcohol dehydrogenase family)
MVTGGASGIGRAAATALVRAGWSVTVTGRRRDRLQRLAEEIGIHPVVADTAVQGEVSAAVAEAVDRFGRLDGLVLNAGILEEGTVATTGLDSWQRQMDINLTGAFLTVQAALPHLLDAKGAIVAVSSVAGLRAPAGSIGYAVSKAGLIMLSHCLAIDHGRHGVRSNVVCPGWTATEMADEEMDDLGEALGVDRAGAYEEVTRLVAMRRPGAAEEVAAGIVWLLSPAASYVNGSVLSIDGGLAAVDPGTVAYDFRVTPR